MNSTAQHPGQPLRYPLKANALTTAFQALSPENIRIDKNGREAQIDGSWPHSRLTKHLKELGFRKTGPKDSLAYVNDEATVGIVLYGAQPHPTKNTWLRYYVEVQARPAAEVGRVPAVTNLTLF